MWRRPRLRFILLWHTLSHTSGTETVPTPTIYLRKVNRIGFIGFCIQDKQPMEITRWIFIDMNIYKAIWHFGRRCFLLSFVASFYSINCSLCAPPHIPPNLWDRLTNLTFTFPILWVGLLHIPGSPLFVCHVNNVLHKVWHVRPDGFHASGRFLTVLGVGGGGARHHCAKAWAEHETWTGTSSVCSLLLPPYSNGGKSGKLLPTWSIWL